MESLQWNPQQFKVNYTLKYSKVKEKCIVKNVNSSITKKIFIIFNLKFV